MRKRAAQSFVIAAVLAQCLFTADSLAQAEKEVGSVIDRVTVFTSGARVTRTATAQVVAGTNILVFSNITSELDPGSVRLQGYGDFTILSVSVRSNFDVQNEAEPEPEAIQLLRKRLEEIIAEEATLRVSMEALTAEEKYITVVTETPLSDERTLVDLVGIADFVRDRLPDVKRRRLAMEASARVLKKESDKVQNQLKEYAASNRRINVAEVVATIAAEAGVAGTFDLTYTVKSASWKTHYDLRSPSVVDPLQIIQYAAIQHRSGEAWTNASVTLSTGDPRLSNVLPVLVPLRLPNPPRRNYEEAEGLVLNETVTTGRAVADRSTAAKSRELDVITEEKRNVTEYTIGPRVTISGDGKDRTFEIRRIEAAASFEYLAVPKRTSAAFLTAHIADWSQYDLDPGEMSLFVDDVFIGKTFLQTEATDDTLSVPMGQDQSVSVKREKRSEFGKRNFFGSKTEVALGFTIAIRNNREEPISITVRDQIPVSTDKSIEVRPGELANARLNQDSGEIEWRLELKAGESRELQFDYSVRFPRGMSLRLD